MAEYPESAPLAMRFDVDLMNTDLDAVRHEQWGAQRPFGQDGSRPETDIDWRILPLRSVGGDPVRTDPGGAGLHDYADTPWLDQDAVSRGDPRQPARAGTRRAAHGARAGRGRA